MIAVIRLLRVMLACASLLIVVAAAQAQDAKAPVPLPNAALF
jgi:hypothetical protein